MNPKAICIKSLSHLCKQFQCMGEYRWMNPNIYCMLILQILCETTFLPQIWEERCCCYGTKTKVQLPVMLKSQIHEAGADTKGKRFLQVLQNLGKWQIPIHLHPPAQAHHSYREGRGGLFSQYNYFSSFSCAPPTALLANGQRLPWPSDWLFYHNTTPAYIFFRYWESVFRKPFYIRNWFSSWRGDSATEPAIRKCLPHLRGDQNV